MRLDKLLANAGVASRANVKKFLKLGLVFVNGALATKADQAVDPSKDQVEVDGERVIYQEYIYLMLHKPKGYVSARVDHRDPTVMSLIEGYDHRDLHIVGRLDKDTTGLILITDDGAFTHHLTSPKHEIPKTYVVSVNQALDSSLVHKFASGFTLGQGEEVKASVLVITEENKANLTIYEGKFHQVKRMFEKFNFEVTALHRASVGQLSLGNLPEGAFRELTPEEISQLKSL
jgi:16S rRNA pseudouridine516 synthase